jgi:hypothetical protein
MCLEPGTAAVAEAAKRALDWNRANPNTARAGRVLVYAWNEHDEGGWRPAALGKTRRRE